MEEGDCTPRHDLRLRGPCLRPPASARGVRGFVGRSASGRVPLRRRIDAEGHDAEVEDQQDGVDRERGMEPDLREAEVLVDEEQDQPEADHQAFLDEEGGGPEVEEEVHDRIGLASAAVEPEHGHEGIGDVEQEDREQQRDVLLRVAVDVAGEVAGTPARARRRGEKRSSQGRVGRARRSRRRRLRPSLLGSPSRAVSRGVVDGRDWVPRLRPSCTRSAPLGRSVADDSGRYRRGPRRI